MATLTLKQAAQYCKAELAPEFENTVFCGACMDTRQLSAGQLFVALKTQARDGHEFALDALEKGAAAILVNKSFACTGFPALCVDDPKQALGQIAAAYRAEKDFFVAAVTGSVGKTTTKELLAAIFAQQGRTGKTQKNFNNDLGLPLSMLMLPDDCETAVLEMGMNHAGELHRLSAIAQPDLAIITNIGTMHIENLGSREAILQAKLEILDSLRPGGQVVFNADDKLLYPQKERYGAICFGIENEAADVRAVNIEQREGKQYFTVCGMQKQFPVVLPAEGRHLVYDALAAITAGLVRNVTPENIQAALANFQNAEMRQDIFEAVGMTVISDCYNAGPESMAAALQVLAEHSCTGRRIAVLGDMLELGSCAQAEHYRVGRLAAKLADRVLTYGNNAQRIVSGAITGGMGLQRAQHFQTQEDLAAMLVKLAQPGDVLLFKGSRGMHMEHVLKLFLEKKRGAEE